MIPTTTSLMKSGWNSNLLKLFFIDQALLLPCTASTASTQSGMKRKTRSVSWTFTVKR